MDDEKVIRNWTKTVAEERGRRWEGEETKK